MSSDGKDVAVEYHETRQANHLHGISDSSLEVGTLLVQILMIPSTNKRTPDRCYCLRRDLRARDSQRSATQGSLHCAQYSWSEVQ